MNHVSLRRRRVATFSFLFIFGALLSGCGDSKTSGTQVEMSDEAKAQINSRRDMYREKSKQKAEERKSKRSGKSSKKSSAAR